MTFSESEKCSNSSRKSSLQRSHANMHIVEHDDLKKIESLNPLCEPCHIIDALAIMLFTVGQTGHTVKCHGRRKIILADAFRVSLIWRKINHEMAIHVQKPP
jgi:hypothetical protein